MSRKPVEFDLIKFQPMPKRFMVWDKEKDDWLFSFDDDGREYEIFDISKLDLVLDEHGYDYGDVIICQSTNLFDKDGKEIFDGSIVRRSWTAAKDDDEAPLSLAVWSPTSAEFVFKDGISSHGVEEIINKKARKDVIVVGHILSNPELSGEDML